MPNKSDGLSWLVGCGVWLCLLSLRSCASLVACSTCCRLSGCEAPEVGIDKLVVPTALLEKAVLMGSWCLIKCGLNELASLSLVVSVRFWLVNKLRTCCSVSVGGPVLLSSGFS